MHHDNYVNYHAVTVSLKPTGGCMNTEVNNTKYISPAWLILEIHLLLTLAVCVDTTSKTQAIAPITLTIIGKHIDR